MLLVADIGNTSTTLGVYDGEDLVNDWKLASNKKRSEDEYGVLINSFIKHANLLGKLEAAIISSVVLPVTERFKVAIEKYLGIPVVVLNHKINTGIKLNVESPREVGPDRIANAYAAYKIYGGPSVVVDFGTATAFDVVSKDGEFIGGIIAPGVRISADALSAYTSMLPKVKIDAPDKIIGCNTVDSMLSGLVRGHMAMIDGLMDGIEKELGEPVIKIATGGYSKIITDHLNKPFDYLSPHLTLDGLRMIYKLNQ